VRAWGGGQGGWGSEARVCVGGVGVVCHPPVGSRDPTHNHTKIHPPPLSLK
jgi:hypothetical protein